MRKRRIPGKTTNTDLALVVQEILDLPLNKRTRYPSEGAQIVLAITRALSRALHSGEEVYVRGFGKFRVEWSKNGFYVPKPVVYNSGKFGPQYNTYSDTPIKYPRKRKVVFIPSVQLTAMLNLENPSTHERTKAISKW